MNIEEIKRELDITWDDPDTDKKVEDAMRSAEALINDFAGQSVDLTEDLVSAQLYKDAVRYYYNGVSDEFETRYSSDLIALRNKYRVKRYDELEKADEV